MRPRGTKAKAFAVALGIAAAAYGEAYIQANCTTSARGAECVFSNTGADPGSGCTTVQLTNRTTHRTLPSARLCSQLLQPRTTVTLPLVFPSGAPDAFCGEGVAVPSWSNCTMSVQMSDVRAVSSGGSGTSTGVSFLVLLSALWVYADAKRIGARKGLVPGLGDVGPGGWFLATLFLWIVAFPLYLSKRGQIRAAAQGHPGAFSAPGFAPPGPYGPPGGGFGPPGAGYPPQGGGFMPPGGGYGPPGGGFMPPGGGAPPGGYGPPGGFGPGGGYGPPGS